MLTAELGSRSRRVRRGPAAGDVTETTEVTPPYPHLIMVDA